MSDWCTCGHSDEQHGNTGISSPCNECDCIDALRPELADKLEAGYKRLAADPEYIAECLARRSARRRSIPAGVTRVVLVHPGGFTEKWAESWDVHIQDDGRTLKLFPRNPTAPRYELTDGFFEGIDPEWVEK